jgi:hypothetical protein
MEALYHSTDGVEALLILNTLVLLKDGPHSYGFALEEERLSPEVRENMEVQRRLDYLLAGTMP